jgi:hypothetical protein
MTEITKVERAKLRRLHAATKHTEDWQAHRDFDDDWVVGVPIDGWSHYQSVCGDTSKACAALIVAARNALPRLLDALDAAEADARDLRDVLRRNNFAPCDIPSCNCNGWHQRSDGDGFYARFCEIDDAVGEHHGRTLLQAVKQIIDERQALWVAHRDVVDERDALQAKLDALVEAADVYRTHYGPTHHNFRVSLDAAIAAATDRQGEAMTDPTKALADAARRVWRTYPSLDTGVAMHELRVAIFAYDAAQATCPIRSPKHLDGLVGVIQATHACKVCGAQWRQWDTDKSWSLVSKTCGKCCDNVAMGDQIVRLCPLCEKATTQVPHHPPVEVNHDEVICPGCGHQFPAMSVSDKKERRDLEEERDALKRHRDDLIGFIRGYGRKLVKFGVKPRMTVGDGIAELARQRDALQAKLDALVEAADVYRRHYGPAKHHLRANLDAAIAAATKVQP